MSKARRLSTHVLVLGIYTCTQAAGEAVQEQHANRLAASEAVVLRLQRALHAVNTLVTAASSAKPPPAGASICKTMTDDLPSQTDDLVSQVEAQSRQPLWSDINGSGGMNLDSPLQPERTRAPGGPTEAAQSKGTVQIDKDGAFPLESSVQPASSAIAPSAISSDTSSISRCSYGPDSRVSQRVKTRHPRSKHDRSWGSHCIHGGVALHDAAALMHMTCAAGDDGPAVDTHDAVVEGVVAEVQRFIATTAMATAAADRLSARQYEQARHHNPLCSFTQWQRIYVLGTDALARNNTDMQRSGSFPKMPAWHCSLLHSNSVQY